MKVPIARLTWWFCGGTGLLCLGCAAPHYPPHQLVLFGRDAPVLRSPRDPAIAQNLTTNLWEKSPFPNRAAEVGVTPFKNIGIQGWRDYHMHAKARGHVMQHEVSANGFRTVDLRLESLAVDNAAVHWKGTRFLRAEIYLGKVSVEPAILDDTNRMLCVEGKLVWDTDGWFEIHPQHSRDVHLETPRKWWQRLFKFKS